MEDRKVRAEIVRGEDRDGFFRWAILDDENGMILDDNGGEGYRSRYSAYVAWYEKLREEDDRKELCRRRRLVSEWVRDHHLIYRLQELSETRKLNAAFFHELLDEMLIEEETLPFSCSDLAHWWNS